jgi:hypothetical protein
MKNPDWLNGPPPHSGEPESKERTKSVFRYLLFELLREKVLEKKFGQAFIEEYNKRRLRRELEDESGMANFNRDPDELLNALEKSLNRERQMHDPLLPEVEDFTDRLASLTTLDEILEVANAEGAALTQADIDEAKMFLGRIMNDHRRGKESF